MKYGIESAIRPERVDVRRVTDHGVRESHISSRPGPCRGAYDWNGGL